MKQFIRNGALPVVIATLAALLIPLAVEARHIIGGEITYECLGPTTGNSRQYRFKMKVYRDCGGNGAEFDDPAQIAIYRGTYSNNVMFSEFGTGSPVSIRLIPDTPRCVQMVPFVCVEQATYTFNATLPVSTESYFIVYQRCCRNEGISNIINPGDVGATYMVEITPDAQQLCNDSPVFNNFPPIIICKNFPLTFDHSATDPDGDQLVYSFCSPFDGGGNITVGQALYSCAGAVPTPPCAPPFDNVPFAVPTYTPGNPMGGNPQININSLTGLITGTPNLLGQFVVGICIQEFRNGVLLSTIKREFQFNVTDCSPTVIADIEEDSISGPSSYVVVSCGSNAVTFLNESRQEEFIDNFVWHFNIPGAPYTNTTDWSPTVVFPDTGTYTGTLYLNPGDICGDTALIRVNIYPRIEANFSFAYDTCVAGPVAFTDLSTGEGIINKWDWNFGVPGGTSDEQDPDYLYPIPGSHPVRLRVTDENFCTDDTLQLINWFPAPPIIIIQPSSFLGCVPGVITFQNLSTPIDSTYDIKWDFGDGTQTEGVISPTHTYNQEGVYDVSVEITSPIGCFISDFYPSLIRVEPSPTANFTFDPNTELSNLNNTIKFTDLSEGANRWNWQFDRFETSTQQNPTFTFSDTGLMKIRLIVTHPKGCKDSLTQYLDIRPEIRWFMPNAFTPNGDGTNDGFFGKGFLFGASDFQMSVWNRWGEKVFETTDPTDEWNGRQMNTGGNSPAGVYVYVVTFTGPRKEKMEFKGFATLIR
jgi:gliding motility-associated-like protein